MYLCIYIPLILRSTLIMRSSCAAQTWNKKKQFDQAVED